ncbi:MAG: hypothetical protein SFX19_07775 [Alphaproteobacteria bacterium]|nr:hypothetical protein [Alphaproteobacteria bacterium]
MLKSLLLALGLIALSSGAALADSYHGHRHHGNHYKSHYKPRTVVSFHFGPTPVYRSRYYHRPQVVYVPQPVPPQIVYISDNSNRAVGGVDGRYCREYQAVSRIGGAKQQTYGTACLQPDGSWEIIS